MPSPMMQQRQVGHVVVMQKVAFERLDVFLSYV
jgi:hypothetical protein